MKRKKIGMAAAMAGLLILGGCGDDGEKKPDHPKSESPKKSEHPEKSEGSGSEHPKSEHPK